MVIEYFDKVKSWISDNKNDLYVALLIFLASVASFGLGRLSILWPKKELVTIDENLEQRAKNIESRLPNDQNSAATINAFGGKYVASKSGKNYHYPWCQGAFKIKEGNKIWFQTKEEAETKGYKPAGNCSGL